MKESKISELARMGDFNSLLDLQRKTDIFSEERVSTTFLMVAMLSEKYDFVKEVLRNNRLRKSIAFNHTNKFGFRLIDYIELFGDSELKELLLKNENIKVEFDKDEFKDKRINTLAMILLENAIEEERVDILSYLYHSKKCQLNSLNEKTRGFFMGIEFNHCMRLVATGKIEFLLKILSSPFLCSRIDFKIEDKFGFNLYDYAKAFHEEELENILIKICPEIKKPKINSSYEELLYSVMSNFTIEESELNNEVVLCFQNCIKNLQLWYRQSILEKYNVKRIKDSSKKQDEPQAPFLKVLNLGLEMLLIASLKAESCSSKISVREKDFNNENILHYAYKLDKVRLLIFLLANYPELEFDKCPSWVPPSRSRIYGGLCDVYLNKKGIRFSTIEQKSNKDYLDITADKFDNENPMQILKNKIKNSALNLTALYKMGIVNKSMLDNSELKLIRSIYCGGFNYKTEVIKKATSVQHQKKCKYKKAVCL